MDPYIFMPPDFFIKIERFLGVSNFIDAKEVSFILVQRCITPRFFHYLASPSFVIQRSYDTEKLRCRRATIQQCYDTVELGFLDVVRIPMNYSVHCVKLLCIKLRQSYDRTELQCSGVAIQDNYSLLYIIIMMCLLSFGLSRLVWFVHSACV